MIRKRQVHFVGLIMKRECTEKQDTDRKSERKRSRRRQRIKYG